MKDWRENWRIDARGKHKGEIKSPSSVCFISNLKVAVAERRNKRIQLFDDFGQPRGIVDKWGGCALLSPSSVFWNNKKLYIADLSRIHVCQEDSNGNLQFVQVSYGPIL